ncbi:MAG: alanine racemase [Bacilli bacterium]
MMYRDTWAEVDLGCIADNVRQVKTWIGSNVRLMAVVKADGYGHGALPVSVTALAAGADWLGVATLDEALELRRAGIVAPILVLGYVAAEYADVAAEYDIVLTVVSVLHATALARMTTDRPLRVHLKIDTGMGRLGVRTDDEIERCGAILRGSCARITGAFTHFAEADSRDKRHALHQLALAQSRFLIVKQYMDGADEPVFHAANSAATLSIPEAHLDMVRFGISLYGIPPSDEVDAEHVPLRPALRLLTRIAQLKTVPAGTTIGYGRTYSTTAETRVATLPIGYADGVLRALSNKGYVTVKGRACPILGRVCMDQIMVDASSVPDVKEGDVAAVYDEHSLRNLSRLAGTIPYELLCAISRRVPRTYIPAGPVR